jgi:two-component sensor histidine kinase
MTVQRSYPYAPSSVTQARHFVAERLETLSDIAVESVLLIVSELATNAIRHAQTGFTIDIDLGENEVRISIADDGGGQPTISSPQPTEPSGRGLRIVELLSDRWGIISSTSHRGKTVWFTLHL